MSLQSSGQDFIAGGRESKEGRQTVFCAPLGPFGDNPGEEEPSNDFLKPRRVHHRSKRTPHQGAVNWINLGQSTRKGIAVLADKV